MDRWDTGFYGGSRGGEEAHLGVFAGRHLSPPRLSHVLCSKVSSRGKRPGCPPFLHISCPEARRGISRLSLPPISTQAFTISRVFVHFSNVGLWVSNWCTVLSLPHPRPGPSQGFSTVRSLVPTRIPGSWKHTIVSSALNPAPYLIPHLWLLRK